VKHLAQLPLPLNAGLPFSNQSTSLAAARSIAPRADSLRTIVLAAIMESRDGLAAFEIERVAGLSGNTVRPRLVELRATKRPLIKDSGRTRNTDSGRPAIVWILA
jgi:hypothetical protein